MDAKEFGKHLKELREKNGLTLKQLGDIIGYSNPYLSQIENGHKGIPGPELIKKIASALDVPFVDLMIDAGHFNKGDKEYLAEKKRISEEIIKNIEVWKSAIEIDESQLEKLILNNGDDKEIESLTTELNNKLSAMNKEIEILKLFNHNVESFIKRSVGKESFEEHLNSHLSSDVELKHHNNVFELSKVLSQHRVVTLNGHHLTNEQKQEILNYAKYLLFSYKNKTDNNK